MTLCLLACAAPVEAPEDLDALFHYAWQRYEAGTDEELRAAVANLLPLLQEESNGLVTLLSDDEQATVALDPPRDPADATGWFVAGPMDCTIGNTEKILYALDQMSLYEDATGSTDYDAYERHYTSDFDAYTARDEAFLTWQTTYTVTPVLSTYTAIISGNMRYVPELDGVGPIVLQRSHLPAPAVFEGDTEDFFDQDYQLDIVIADGDTVVHGYANWRDLESLGLPDEDAGVQNLLIDGLTDYYADLVTVCAYGGY